MDERGGVLPASSIPILGTENVHVQKMDSGHMPSPSSLPSPQPYPIHPSQHYSVFRLLWPPGFLLRGRALPCLPLLPPLSVRTSVSAAPSLLGLGNETAQVGGAFQKEEQHHGNPRAGLGHALCFGHGS